MSPLKALSLVPVLAGSLLLGYSSLQTEPITRKQLRELLVGLGYEVTDIVKDEGKEKYRCDFERDGLKIPVGYEISPSGNYIWLTVNLGKPNLDGEKALNLLKQNARIQPTFFYFTDSGFLMAGLAIENRAVSNVVLRQRSESIAANIGSTKSFWQFEPITGGQ